MDPLAAVYWLRKAADQGVLRAQVNLATVLAEGRGVPQDCFEACRWLEIVLQGLQRDDQPIDRFEMSRLDPVACE